MKQFTKMQLELLQQLSDGQYHSGNEIGKQLSISRTAVWKYISQLAELGVPIKRIPQQGYQLTSPLKLLKEELIRQYLVERQFDKQVNFHLFSSIDSTNIFLKKLPNSPFIDICCAEKQTQGRGRFGREWVSPFGENIYCSSRWNLNCCLSYLSGLSLIVGLAILATLRDSNIHQAVHIKWPNDILWNQKKLCGILIEAIGEANSCAQIIIGIGLNVNTPTHKQSLADKPWCSLYEMTNTYFDRNLLVANLIHNLGIYIEKFLTKGFAAFNEEWEKADFLRGQFITVSQPTAEINGLACGVNELGQLCLQDKSGKMHYLSSGDTSLRSFKLN